MSTRRLTVNILLRMSPVADKHDIVAVATAKLLVSHLKNTPILRAIFKTNKNEELDKYIQQHLDWFDFEYFAIIYVCYAMAKYKDPYKIHSMVDGKKAEELLKEEYDSAGWKKVGFALYCKLFPDLLQDTKSDVKFREYMDDDGPLWAQALCDKVQESHWIYGVMRGIVTGSYKPDDYNRDMNLLFLKLHLLDPKSVMPAYQFLSKALPDLRLELVTRDYLGGHLDWNLIKQDLVSAVGLPSSARNTSHISLVEGNEVYHGLDVIYFILNEAKALGLYTGEQPDNKREELRKEACCIL